MAEPETIPDDKFLMTPAKVTHDNGVTTVWFPGISDAGLWDTTLAEAQRVAERYGLTVETANMP